MDGEHSEPIDVYTLCNEKHPDKKLTNKLQIYRINVPYFTKKCYNLREEELAYKDRFIGMIGAKTLKEINKIAGRDNIMEEMSKKVEECNEDEDILYQYNYGEYLADLAILEGTEKGIKQGLEKGMKQGLEKGMQQGLEKGFEEGKTKGFEEGKSKGYEEGLNLGKQEALKQQEKIIEESKNEYKVDMITKMLAKGLSPEVISEITGLEVEKIAEIDL